MNCVLTQSPVLHDSAWLHPHCCWFLERVVRSWCQRMHPHFQMGYTKCSFVDSPIELICDGPSLLHSMPTPQWTINRHPSLTSLIKAAVSWMSRFPCRGESPSKTYFCKGITLYDIPGEFRLISWTMIETPWDVSGYIRV